MTDLRHWLATNILSLGMAADEARRAGPAGSIVTYRRVFVMTPAELAAGVAVPDAASEVRLYRIPAGYGEALAEVRALKVLAGARRATAFSMAAIEDRARGGWGPLADVLGGLSDAGLSDVAELPVDQLVDLSASMRLMKEAGLQAQRVTVSHPLNDRKLDVLDSVQRALALTNGRLSFAPLPRHAPADKPTTGYEDLRMVALARLAVGRSDGDGPRVSVEVDWSLYGSKLAQIALTFGADHLDAVPATSDPSLGPRRGTIEDVERNIRAAGFEPREHRPSA